MSIERTFDLIINAGTSSPLVINANQNDSGEIWKFNLYQEDGTKVIPAAGEIVGLKSDGHAIVNAGTVNSSGQVVITETAQITAAPGANVYEIVFDSVHGTANFILYVEKSPVDDDADFSESDISAIQQAIAMAIDAQTVAALQNGLAQESATRAAQDAQLAGDISEEATTRAAADAVLRQAIDDAAIVPAGSTVVVDNTLSIAGAAADAKVTGNSLSDLDQANEDLKNELNYLGVLNLKPVASTSIIKTETENTNEPIKLEGEYKAGKIYRIAVTLNDVTWNSNGVQYVKIGLYDVNSISSSHQIEVFRLATEKVYGSFEISYTPPADGVMIGFNFYLGAGTQDIDIDVSEVVSDIGKDVDSLLTQAENIMPLVSTVTESFSGTLDETGLATLYIPYEFYKHYRYKLTFECILGTSNGGNCLRVQTASAQNFNTAYRQDIINNATSINPLCGVIDDFDTGDIINESFVATKNGAYLAFRYYGVANSNYQINVGVSRIASVQQTDDVLFGKGVVDLNKDVEPYVLQLGREISPQTQVHSYKRLNFVFFSDIHAKADLWERICDYMDEYNDIIPFAIHGGDYVSNDLSDSSIVDLYGLRKPAHAPILNTVGNHDCYPSGSTSPTADAETVYGVLYNSVNPTTDGWDCTFGSGSYVMYWYKDIADAGVRIICLDQYHWDSDQLDFLHNALSDAKTNGYAVVTVAHTPITTDVSDVGSGFFTLDNWVINDTYQGAMVDIRAAINTFTAGGGIHLIHLCGHIHSDEFAECRTDHILQFRTQQAGATRTVNVGLWTDSNRVIGTKTYDCFNVMQIDRNLGMIKIVRIGCNSSDTLQPRTTLCWDYVNRRLIANN